MSAPGRDSYHHGDLRAALLTSAMLLLESGEPFSLRGVARHAGVSATAPYRHFTDREALESALAAQGFKDLKAHLLAGRDLPSSVEDLAEFGVAYVDFALTRPAVFRLMFGNECDDTNDQRVLAAGQLHELLAELLAKVFPGRDDDEFPTAVWALVHGLAFLHLDGKLSASSAEEVAARVRAAVEAILAARV